MNFSRWQELMAKCGFEDNVKTFEDLDKAYAESHRYYHNRQHVSACLEHLDTTSVLVSKPEEIELALWFHDAIYSPFSSNNEEDSAEWSKKFLSKNNATKDLINNVYRLIMATLHNHQPTQEDEKLLVDIDLSILGSRTEVYKQFEVNVRKEYKFVPKIIYVKKRKEILRGFLNRDSIYSTEYFYDNFEVSARKNLKRAIDSL